MCLEPLRGLAGEIFAVALPSTVPLPTGCHKSVLAATVHACAGRTKGPPHVYSLTPMHSARYLCRDVLPQREVRHRQLRVAMLVPEADARPRRRVGRQEWAALLPLGEVLVDQQRLEERDARLRVAQRRHRQLLACCNHTCVILRTLDSRASLICWLNGNKIFGMMQLSMLPSC